VEGTLGTPEDGYVFTGDILADFEDLAPLGTLLERDLGGVLRADLSGTIRPDLSALDVTFDATARDLETGIPQIDRLLAGEGTVTGRAARDGTDLLLEDLRIDTDLVQGTISAEFEDGVGSADLDLALSDVAPVLGGLSGEGRITGTARQTGEGTTALDLDLALPTGTARVEGTLGTPLQGFAFTGDILADFEDIAPLGALLGRDLQGALRADLTGTIRPDLSVLDVTFDATARDLALGVPQLDRLLAGEGTFAGSLARDGADLRLDGVRIDTTLVQGTVSAEFEDGVGSADVDLSLPDVAPVLGGLSGEGRITGTARQTGEGTTDLDLRVALPTGEATVDGTLEGGAEGLAFAGDVAADFEDVAPLGTLLGRDLAGAVQGTASGTARLDLSALDLAFDLATRDLEVGIPLLDPLLAGEGTLAGRAARDGDDLRLEDVRIDTDLLDGTVTAAFEDGVGSADVDLTLADVEPILGGLSGEGRITGTARQTGGAHRPRPPRGAPHRRGHGGRHPCGPRGGLRLHRRPRRRLRGHRPPGHPSRARPRGGGGRHGHRHDPARPVRAGPRLRGRHAGPPDGRRPPRHASRGRGHRRRPRHAQRPHLLPPRGRDRPDRPPLGHRHRPSSRTARARPSST
jgi:translocation and assembly module TamB